jgi:hypothetical protein
VNFAKNVLFTIIILSSTCAMSLELPAKLLLSENRATYSKYCKGQFAEVYQDLKIAKQGAPDYLPSRVMQLYTKEGQSQVNEYLQKLPADVGSISEVDRVIASTYLLFSHSSDIERIRGLLAFNSATPTIENYRKITESYIDDIDGKRSAALKKRIDAFIDFPYINSLTEVFATASQDRSAERILTPFFKYIDQIDNSDPAKFVILACKQIAISNFQEVEKISFYLKQAYDLCPHDQSIAQFYVSLLMFEKKYVEAEKILTAQVNSNEYYSNHFDLFLSQIYFIKNDINKAKVYKDKAIANKSYFPEPLKAQVDSLGPIQSPSESSFSWSTAGLIVIIFLAALILLKYFKQRAK